MVNQLASEAKADPRLGVGGNKPPKVHEMLAIELTDTYRQELDKSQPIADRANNAPEKIESDDDQKLWTSIYLDADTLYKQLDGSRLMEQRPLVAVLKTVFGPTLERLERITGHARKLSDAYNRDKLAKERAEREAEQKRLREAADRAAEEARIAAEFGDAAAEFEHAQASVASHIEAVQLQASAPKSADVARVRADDGGGMSTVATEWKFEIADYALVDLNAIRLQLDPKDIDKAIRKIVKVQKGNTKIAGVRVFEDFATQFRR